MRRVTGFSNCFKVLILLSKLTSSSALAQPLHGDEYWENPFGIADENNFNVRAVALAGKTLYAAGYFHSIGGVAATNIAKWNGDAWEPLGEGLGAGEETVNALAIFDSDLYAAGSFTQSGSQPVHRIAKWDGEAWSEVGGGLNDIAFTLATAGTNLYVGGHMTSAGSTPANKIARWNGSEWSSLGDGLSRIIYAHGWIDIARVDTLAAVRNELYVGGEFFLAGGQPATNIAKWDGAKWSPMGEGLTGGAVRTIAFFQNEIYAGGGFKQSGDLPLAQIAKWDGLTWMSVGDGVQDGVSIRTLSANGQFLFAGGTFTRIGGVLANRVAQWDGQAWFPLGSGVPSAVVVVSSQSGGLILGGQFMRVGDTGATNLAIWHIPQTLKIDQSGDALSISWPKPDTNLVLEASASLDENSWSPVEQSPTLLGHRWTITTNTSATSTFFRLRSSE